MNATEIANILKGVKSWSDASSYARGAFVHEMKGRQYGYSALLSAWVWFLAGWNADETDEG